MEPNVTPERIFDLMNSFQKTAALKAALELDLFSAIGKGLGRPDALAREVAASERGVRILCDFLVVHGLLTKNGGHYGLAPDAATFLDRSSPAYVGSAARFLTHPEMVRAYSDIAAAVRKGGTAMPGNGSIEAENPIWIEFARGMAPLIRPAAEFIAELVLGWRDPAQPLEVLDVAAGHGLFGISLARRFPKAQIHAVDWPGVLEVARENAAAAGVAERLHLLPGSAFEVDFGGGHDVALLTNFFHHFDKPTCVGLMRKVHAALKEDGRAIVLEFVPNEDRVSPPQPAAFSFIMLASTPAGDAYTFSEYQSMFGEAGFSGVELHDPPGLPQNVLVAAK